MPSIIKCLSDVWCIACINSKDFLLIDKDKKVSKRKYSLQVQCLFYQRESNCFFFENTKTSYNKEGGGLSLLPNWWTLIKESYMILAPAMLTIVWILLLNVLHVCYPLTYIFYNFYSTVLGHFSICSRIKLRLRDATFKMQFMFSCLAFKN